MLRPATAIAPRDPRSTSTTATRQPYSLTIEVHGGEIYGEESGWLAYQLFEQLPGTKGPLWTYRRLIDAAALPRASARDITMFNWPGNDYRDESILDRPAASGAAALQDAKRVSLGFLHWLQTEAPAEAARRGAPELLLRPDVMGTADGLAKHPYIREARRIRALRTVVEQDVSAEFQPGAAGGPFPRLGGHRLVPDRHPPFGPGGRRRQHAHTPVSDPARRADPGRDSRTWPPAAKNIGTTHITNGCYRLHPVEWNIGEAAGALADWSLARRQSPERIWRDGAATRRFQQRLLEDGVPLAWVIDVPLADPAFVAVQILAAGR